MVITIGSKTNNTTIKEIRDWAEEKIRLLLFDQ